MRPSGSGPYPLELLRGFFRFLGDGLPLRYLTDGARSLVFFDGSLDAGLGRALVVLALALAIDGRSERARLHGIGGSSSRALHLAGLPSSQVNQGGRNR